jgi:DeoR/GlpR family transcriptional regulator of sugar metabolism
VLAPQRRDAILAMVRHTGAVRVSDLTRSLGVSDMTIRRDLEVLSRQGLLEKVHGGATAAPSSTDEPGFEAKSVRQRLEKEAIARAAATLVEPGQAVALSAGTTTWTLAHLLRNVPGLTVVTNSVQVADVFRHGPREDQTIILTGGVRTPSDALVGPVAVSALRGLNVDTVFMGAHGMDVRTGFTTPNLMEADTDRALMGCGRTVVLTVDSTKWGIIGISTFAQLSQADVLVTDAGLAPERRQALGERVGDLVVAELPTSSSPQVANGA